MLDKITRGVIILSLITFPQSYSSPSFAIICNKNKESINFKTKEEGYKNIQNQAEEIKRIKEQERLQKLKEEEQKQEEERRRIEEEKNNRTFLVSYYGATYSECGNNHFITASGVPVQQGHIAVPKSIPFGSKIIIEGNEYIATDTGNPEYICELSDGTLRVDVFIERLHGENDYQYEKRINNMGVKKVVGKLYLK